MLEICAICKTNKKNDEKTTKPMKYKNTSLTMKKKQQNQ